MTNDVENAEVPFFLTEKASVEIILTPEIIQRANSFIEKIRKYEVPVQRLCDMISSLEISDDATCQMALELRNEVRDHSKAITEDLAETLRPLRQIMLFCRDNAKLLTESLGTAEDSLKMKTSFWHSQMEKEAEESRVAMKKRYEALNLSVNIYTSDTPKSLSSANTIASSKIKKGFKVADESLIPREYLMVDEKKVMQAIKMGVTQIPGIELTEEKTIVMRKR